MRIISGKYKAKRIIAPKNLPVRPTTDMAKEGIFNVINNEYYIENLIVLDLFSGTGNIAYEFASRGTSSITAVDSNHNCIKFIKSMSAEMEFDQINAIQSDVFKFIETSKSTFRLIYADPPYGMEGQEEMVESILSGNLLSDDGWLILEHDPHHDFSKIEGFEQLRRYGSVNFSIFAKTDNQ